MRPSHQRALGILVWVTMCVLMMGAVLMTTVNMPWPYFAVFGTGLTIAAFFLTSRFAEWLWYKTGRQCLCHGCRTIRKLRDDW